MEKKSLGRGLEDIADIFISQKKDTASPDDFPPENPNKVTGESCPNHSFSASKGSKSFSEDDIITAIDERLKVTRNCHNTEHPVEQDLSGRNENFRTSDTENTPQDSPDIFEITEHVISKKKLGYFNTPHVQQTIIKTLNQHLRQNYCIKKIELVKVNEVSCPGIKNIVEENISIYIKEKENL
jgi:hypothetical protein